MIQALFVIFIIFFGVNFAKAGELRLSLEASGLHVQGEISHLELREVSFLSSYAQFSGLEKRIQNLRFFNGQGSEVEYEEVSPGRFRTSEEIFRFSYTVNTKLSDQPADSSISWTSESLGLLLLNDLVFLQLQELGFKVSIELADEWKSFSNCEKLSENVFLARRVSEAVFLIGKELRSSIFRINEKSFEIVFAGRWQFSDEEAVRSVKEIFSWYEKNIGKLEFARVQIFLIPFLQDNVFDRWNAQTLGATVILVAAPNSFVTNAIDSFNDRIRHELLHLWIPNSLGLSGKYDWFFEGFVVYQALKTGVLLGQIRFEDFLSAISRALSFAAKNRKSLIEASVRRWHDSNRVVYSKGLVVAFLFDMKLMIKDEPGLEKVFRELLKRYKLGSKHDGNLVIVNLLSEIDRETVKRYIEGTDEIKLEDVRHFGIEVRWEDDKAKLEITRNLSRKQKNLLKMLGYNQTSHKNLRQMRVSSR
ncbi:MAG: hypothetical protein N2Z23_06085 [Pyrinomonadaceae bacterium]|nr:hypothetical protein [Pyrinomonadaceae bacterium]MCX7639992.1 hypothetical protein [Pyrinomonadaceae bacterium]MDW8304164.1 hypothetical protein [Acidobacteriota bacterium]